MMNLKLDQYTRDKVFWGIVLILLFIGIQKLEVINNLEWWVVIGAAVVLIIMKNGKKHK